MKKERGFSFHELAIALFLINLVVFSVLGVITTLMKSSRGVNENSKSVIAANSILETYLAGDEEFQKKFQSDATGNDKALTGQITYADIEYHFHIEDVTVRQTQPGFPGMKQITITVSTSPDFLTKPTNKDIKITTLKVIN